MSELLTALGIRDAIAAKKLSSVEAVRDCLGRIEKHNPTLGAYLSTFADKAMRDAAAVDEKIAARLPVGPLAGVPVRGTICTAFRTTTCGSKILQLLCPYNARRRAVLAADAVIVGKTNQRGLHWVEHRKLGLCAKTAHGTARVPAAAARLGGGVAAGLCAAALGSDTGGSIRQPASFCGVTGLKPTYGRVSRYGLVAYGSSLDQIGPMTRDVADAALLMNVIAGYDRRDSTSVPETMAAKPDYLAEIDKPIDGLKIAVVPQLNAGADPAVQAAVEKA